MNSLVTKNIISNYFGKIWSFVSVYLFVPLYIKVLGIESYAVINFYTVFLVIMFFADAGLSATFQREVARTTDKKYLGNLLFTIEKIYLFICIGLVLLIGCSAPLIATHWLKAESISSADLTLYIILMGLGLSLQFFATLHTGGLMGLQKQILANGIQVSWNFVRSGLVLIPIFFLPDLAIFFAWQIIVNLAFLIYTRKKLWHFIRPEESVKPDFSLLKGLWKFALGMMIMSVIVAVNTQLDKLLVSKILSLTEFGFYSLAALFAQSPTIITTPIALAVIPELTMLVSNGHKQELRQLFMRYSFLISSFATGVGIVLFLYTKDFLLLWTHNPLIAGKADYVAKTLLVGGVFLSFQLMPYYLSIANGYSKANIKLGIACIIFLIPSLIILTNKYGTIGAAIPWLCINSISTVVLGYILINKFLKGEFMSWMINCIVIPIAISIALGYLCYAIFSFLPQGYYILIYAAVIGLILLTANIKVYNLLNKSNSIRILQLLKK